MNSEHRCFEATVASLLFLSCSVAIHLLVTDARNISWEAGERQSVGAKEGGRAVLPCYLSPETVERSLGELHKRLSVRWERHGNNSHQVHRMVLEVAPSGLKIRASSMMPRASVQDTAFLQGSFSLQIEPVLSKDAGRYRAEVRYGSTVHLCEVQLDVVSVTANPPGPVVESEPVKLTCNSTLPEKPVKIRWFRAGHPISPSSRFWSEDQSLFISRSTVNDSGSWVCELSYADSKRISATHQLHVLGFAGPVFPVVYAAAESDAHLPCRLNDDPVDYKATKVAVRWSHVTEDDLAAKSNLHSENNTDFILHLPAVGPDSAGRYVCEVSINGTTISKNVSLVVMTVTPSIEGPVLEGSSLSLSCDLSNPPGKLRFQWKRLSSGSTKRSGAPSGSSEDLTWGKTQEFSSVSPADAGTWECSVHSTEGMVGAVRYHLEIAGPQVASQQQDATPGKITGGLISFLAVLVVAIVILALLRRRTHSLNFPALDGLVAVATLPRKETKEGDCEEKVLQRD